MYSIAVCDDSPQTLEDISRKLSRCISDIQYEAVSFGDTAALLSYMQSGARVDIVILDIVLPGEDGVCAARRINELYPHTCIIFMTGHPDCAGDISEAEYQYFVIKPVCEEKLRAALLRAAGRINAHRKEKLLLPVGNDYLSIDADDIICFERERRITVVTSALSVFNTRLRLDDLERMIPQGMFARPHSSFLVNLERVRYLRAAEVIMMSGKIIPISRQRKADFREAFFARLAGSARRDDH